MTILDRFRHGVLVALGLGVLFYLGYAVWVGVGDVGRALASFAWALLPVILGLSLANFGVRFVRWQLYLRELGLSVPRRTSLLVFLAGLAMTLTPGKVGEFLKSYLLRETRGIPMPVSAPVVFVERLTDLLALVLLASFGVASHWRGAGLSLLAAVAGGILLGIVVLHRPALTRRTLGLLERLPVGRRIAPKLEEMVEASRRLLGVRPLAYGLALGTLAWLCECLGYCLAVRGFGVDFSPALATFAYAFSTLAGVVSPGGLGPTDVGLIELARSFTPGLSREVATAASFLVRLCTLWFAVLLGAQALLFFRRLVAVDVDIARQSAAVTPRTE